MKKIFITFLYCTALFTCFSQFSMYSRELSIVHYNDTISSSIFTLRIEQQNFRFFSSENIHNFKGELECSKYDSITFNFALQDSSNSEYSFVIMIKNNQAKLNIERFNDGLQTLFINEYCTIWKTSEDDYLIQFFHLSTPFEKPIYYRLQLK